MSSSQPGGPTDPPLKGLKVVELARILAGPWAGQVLADLGAEVIKVERPELGDDTRKWGPPFSTHADGSRACATYFHSCNRGKKSVVADIATSQGQAVVHDLASQADVLIENFKVGGLAKYGLDYASLAALNPRLVFCSITGFGHTGPYAPRAGYDLLIQAMGGIMDITGEADGPPIKPGVAYADIFTGLYAVIAIQAALAERHRSGLGQHIDMALFDTQVGVLANQATSHLMTGVMPKRQGSGHPSIVPYEPVPTADGHVIIACGNDRQFQRLCTALDLPEMADNPDFASNELRVSHRAEIITRLTARTRELESAEILERLEAVVVPAGPINSVAEVFEDPQTIARAMRVDLPSSDTAGVVPCVRTPINYSRSRLALEQASPSLGTHQGGFQSVAEEGGEEK